MSRHEDPIQLGFAEPLEADDTPASYEFDRIGGHPVWLHAMTPLPSDRRRCSACGQAMPLLLQVFTPEDCPEEAHARVLYLFACRNGNCLRDPGAVAVRAFRSQWHADPTPATALAPPPADAPAPFPLFALVSEDEPAEDAAAAAQDLALQMKGVVVADGDAPGVDESEETGVGVDPTFLAFQARIEREPQQAFRYVRTRYTEADVGLDMSEDDAGADSEDEDEAAESKNDQAPKSLSSNARALFACDVGKPDPASLVCRYCAGPQDLECQVMPQILRHIQADHSDAAAMDFGTLLVYTCRANCQPTTATVPEADSAMPTVAGSDKLAYMEERMVLQPFSLDGMSLANPGPQFKA